MDIAEANRQYQIAMEHRRRGVEAIGDVLSLADELQEAYDDERAALREAELVWLHELVA